jgi:zinc transporter ZupT
MALRLLAAVSMAALGAVIAVSFKKISHQGLCILISFAAGALLAVAAFDIIPEAIEMVGRWSAGGSVLAGYALFFALGRFVSHVCPACSATHTEINFKAVTITMMAALAIHSLMDGLAIYSGYLTTSNLGLLILLGVAFHKLPEGMALALVARGAGLSRLRSFGVACGLEAVTTLGGGLIGFLALVPGAENWIGYVLGFVGGGFIYLVFHALLSEVFRHHPVSTLIAATLGGTSIFLIGSQLGQHAH